MRFNYGKIVCSLFLCSCLLGCGQVKEAISAALDDDDDDVVAVQTGEANGIGGEAEVMGIREGGCVVGNADGYGGATAENCGPDSAGGLANSGMGTDVYVSNGEAPGQVQQVSANLGANAGGNNFSLIDQATNMAVESYRLPAGWQGTGQVLRPPMQSIYWQSYFLNQQTGSVGFRFFTVSSNGVGPYRNSPWLQKDYLAINILQDVQNFLPLQNVKVVSADFSPHDTPENRQMIQFMKSQNKAGIPTNYAPLQYHAVVSMTCNGQPYKADIISNLMCREQMIPRATVHNVTVQNSYGVVAPAAQLPQTKKAVLGILASRSENQQWVQYGMQYNNQQMQQGNAHFDRMNQIVQDRNNHINNVQQQMNQNTAATMDRVRQGQHEMITETTDINNPLNPGTAVTTDNNFNHAWTNSQGQVINTDSTLYNPNSDQDLNGVEWTQIK
ncbi:MAG: hypothetical protein Q4F00_12305 [bacterium]|nr:hypothetical protein [bacterium]